MKSLIESNGILGSERNYQLLEKYISQLVGDPNYIYRVTACSFLK